MTKREYGRMVKKALENTTIGQARKRRGEIEKLKKIVFREFKIKWLAERLLEFFIWVETMKSKLFAKKRPSKEELLRRQMKAIIKGARQQGLPIPPGYREVGK